MRTVWAIAFGLLLLVACNTEKRRLTERLSALQQEHAALEQRLESRRRGLRDSEERLAGLNGDLAAHNTAVHTFIENHKVAAACIRATQSSYSSEVSATTRFGAAVCGVALLNDTFAREVAQAGDHLAEAEARAKDLQEEMAEVQRTIAAGRLRVDQDRAAVDEVAGEMLEVRRRLSPK